MKNCENLWKSIENYENLWNTMNVLRWLEASLESSKDQHTLADAGLASTGSGMLSGLFCFTCKTQSMHCRLIFHIFVWFNYCNWHFSYTVSNRSEYVKLTRVKLSEIDFHAPILHLKGRNHWYSQTSVWHRELDEKNSQNMAVVENGKLIK